METRFETHFDLAKLDYFELVDGRRLRLRDRSLGPVADVHTHLALAFGRPHQMDLWQAPDRTHHYLPMERGLDLDLYMNRNLSVGDLQALKRDLTWASLTAGGLRATHTV